MSKVLKTVVMRVTPDEAAKLRYQRKFDAAWQIEQNMVRLKAMWAKQDAADPEMGAFWADIAGDLQDAWPSLSAGKIQLAVLPISLVEVSQ